jgi:DNA-binding NarL/FixJ family response regulator
METPELLPKSSLAEKTRVLVVDDHPLLRGGLVQLINKEPDLTVCAEAGDAGGTILAVDDDPPPDLVVLDLMLGYSDGLELIKQLRAVRPGLLILVVSMHDELIYAERAIRAGASGYVMKKEASEAVLSAMRRVLAGEIYLSPRMQVLLSEKGLAPEPSRFLVPSAEPPLSDRELHVFRLIGAGVSTKQIANELHLSVKTIETYRENLKIKLKLPNAVALAKSAKEWIETF